jgi:Cdc6-like AAA superfamily ATPase/ribosomal protein L17
MGNNRQISITHIENAFLPSREITEPDRFSGRKSFVHYSYLSLIADGANLAILGNRGIGKSSLARQIINISTGNNSLLEKLGINYDAKLDFLSIYFACGNNISTISDLLLQLLTLKDCLHGWIYDIPNTIKEIDKISGGIDLAFVKAGGEGTVESSKSPALIQHTVETIFINVLHDIAKSQIAKNGILIVIDEFDQIQNADGFAALLKSLATNNPKVKFCIVGVAHDIQNLMKEHESSDRLFAGGIISLPSMSEDELIDIILKAQASINEFIVFDENAVKKLLQLAQGHPYMIHLLGKYSLRTAYMNGYNIITEAHINETLQSIADSGADPVLEGRYKKAVASSSQREAVLKSFAKSIKENGEILTTDAYKLALESDVDNASQYVGQLVTEDYGEELIKVRERYYRFKDSLFVAYVNARPYIFRIVNDN